MKSPDSNVSSTVDQWEERIQEARDLANTGNTVGAAQRIIDASSPPETEEQLAAAYELCVGDKPAELRDLAESFVETHSESATAHMVCAQLASHCGDAASANSHYQTAISLNPEYQDEELEHWLAENAEETTDSSEAPDTPDIPAPAGAIPPPNGAIPPPAAAIPPPAAAVDAPASEPDAIPAPNLAVDAAPAPAPAPDPASSDGEIAPVTPVKLTKSPPPALERQEEDHSEELREQALAATGLDTASPFDHLELVRTDGPPKDTKEKASAIGIAVLVHALIFFILTLIVVAVPRANPPQIRAVAAPNSDVPPDPTKKEVQKMAKPNPASASRVNVISVNNTSAVNVPVVVDPIDSLEPIGVGADFGMQMSFGADGAGNVSFFGSQSAAQKVVFVVDASASMSSKVQGSNIDKFALMQQELTKSIKQLPPGIDYQVIFFAGPCWYAGDEVSREKENKDGNMGQMVEADKEEYFWFEGPYPKDRSPNGGTALYHFEEEDEDKLPKAEWISSSKANIHKTTKHIEECPKIFGTDWRWPLRMAMNLEPDVIYFMTDGAFGLRGEDVIGDLVAYNRRKSRAKVNTICLMELRAYEELQELADDTKGEFTLVLFDGTTLHGKEIDKWIKENPGLVQ
ncbi:MAG: hypothetical protein AAF591_13585 [Verrucomicrobiota bacterium]